jgi:hypothetical protein
VRDTKLHARLEALFRQPVGEAVSRSLCRRLWVA